MNKTRVPNGFAYDASTHEWVFENGRRLPVVSGGDPTADPNAVVIPADPAPVPPQGQVPQAGDNVFTLEQVHEAIEKARSQEKDKLYPRLDEMKAQLDAIKAERDAQAEAARQAAEAAAAERRAQEEAEMSAKDLLKRTEDEWTARFNQREAEIKQQFEALRNETEAHKAALEKEQQFQQLEVYKTRRLNDEAENIMPELADLVGGNSEEEIEESIARVVAKTATIVGNIQQQVGLGAPAPRPTKGIPATGGGPSGPLENATEQQTLTPQQIAAMSMEEYAKVRGRLLAATSRRR